VVWDQVNGRRAALRGVPRAFIPKRSMRRVRGAKAAGATEIVVVGLPWRGEGLDVQLAGAGTDRSGLHLGESSSLGSVHGAAGERM